MISRIQLPRSVLVTSKEALILMLHYKLVSLSRETTFYECVQQIYNNIKKSYKNVHVPYIRLKYVT